MITMTILAKTLLVCNAESLSLENALAIDLVLAESKLAELVLSVGCSAEGPDVLFGRPPVEFG